MILERVKRLFQPQVSPITLCDAIAAILLAAAVGVFGLMSQDKQGIYMGSHICGIYCTMAVNYGEYLTQQSFDTYYFQKSLLSFFAWVIMNVGAIAKTPTNANMIIEILSAFLLAGSAWAWSAIARYHSLSRTAFWVGTLGMFLCQIFVKLVPYAQESPDTAAFFLGMLSLYAVTCSQHRLIIPIYITTSFVQPQLSIFLAPVYILSYGWSVQARLPATVEKLRALVQSFSEKARQKKDSGAWHLFAAYTLILIALACLFWFGIRPTHGRDNSIPLLMPLSIPLCAGLITFLLHKMQLFTLIDAVSIRMKEREFWRRLGIVVAIQIAVKILVSIFARGEIMSGTSTTARAIYTYLSFHYQSIEQPLKLLTAPSVFFGAAFVLIFLSLRRVRANMLALPDHLPVSCAVVLFIFLFPDTESRHFIAFLPWFMLLALKGRSFHPLYVALFATLSIVGSRFYADYAPLDPKVDTYLMTWGPWFTREVYWRGAALTVILFLALWGADKYLKAKHDA